MELKEFFKENEKKYGDTVWTNFYMDSNFLKENPNESYIKSSDVIEREELGMFFWERGGKQFVKTFRLTPLKELQQFAKDTLFIKHDENGNNPHRSFYCLDAQDFLDALACLGEEKVKELIKEMEK